MEKTASDLSQQSAQDEGVAKEAPESVADMKSKLCHEGGGDILKRSGDKSSINHMQNGVNGTVSQSRHSSSSKSKEHGSSSKHGSSGSSSHKHSTSASSHKHDQGSSSSHKYVSSSSGKHKEGSSSSSGKHRDGSSSSKDKHGEKISSKEKHGEDRSSNKEKQGNERSSIGEKQGNSSRGEDKHHESSSSSKDKAKHSSSSNYSREKEKSSDKLKSSNSSKEGDRHKSSSSNKHEDKEREKSKERSSSKHKEGSSGGSGERKKEEKPKGIDRPKDTRDVERDKEKSSDKQQPKQVVDLQPRIKEEPKSPVKEEYSPVKDKFTSGVKKEIKQNPESDDDLPLAQRVNQDKPEKAVKRPANKDDEDDDEPLAGRLEMVKKIKKEEPPSKPKKRKAEESYDDKPLKKVKKVKKEGKQEREEPEEGKKKRGKKEDEQPEVWKWWEEEKRGDGVKWTFLEHKGPVFAPLYEPLPNDINFYYDGKKMKLSLPAEEVATFYARMLEHDYTTRDVFNSNFFKDWRKMMTPEEKSTITDLRKCNFKEMYEYFKAKSEERKNMSKEEKKKIKTQNESIQKEYGVCMMDGHKEKIGNFKIEPPGLFRGRGDHPKQGMLKMRINPEDVIINCSSDSKIPQPPAGHRWKKVLHDNKVTWLASWNENIQGQTKYVMLNAASKLKGEKDWQKYEIARKLHRTVDKIRAQYREDWKSKEMRIRQRAVALYFIDKLALRAGNEKEEGETADTVGCCSLRVEHIKLHDELDGKENVVEFDFLGKDSIRYYNTVSVDKRVYKNLKIFMDNKQPGDDLFDRLNTSIMNKHLNSLMEGLTAKVFRTYNASKTLQEQLNLLTNPDDPVPAKLLSYNRANRAVAILCNHQRSVPKNFSKQMETLQIKIDAKKDNIRDAKKQLKEAKANFKASKTPKNKMVYEKKKKAVERLEDQLTKLEVQATDKDENKEIALGTSKLNYLDPRISVAWCKKCNVPLEKIYNKTHRAKFQWAIDMAGPDFEF